MTLADEFRDLEVELASEFGALITLTVPAQSYVEDGTVAVASESTATILAEGPVDESRRYQQGGTDQRVTCTFYVPSKGHALTPNTASRITSMGRTWQVYAVTPSVVQGISTAWRLDCGEVPSG